MLINDRWIVKDSVDNIICFVDATSVLMVRCKLSLPLGDEMLDET